jgi:hypothetical protein
LSTSFVSVSTANPTLICAKPAAACTNRPLLPSTMFHVAIRKVPLPSGKKGVELSSMASITLARRQRPKSQKMAKNDFLGSHAVTNCTSGPAQPHRPRRDGGGARLYFTLIASVVGESVIGHGIGGKHIPTKWRVSLRPYAGVSNDGLLVCHHLILRPLKLVMALRSNYVDATYYEDILPNS